jgi:IS30 family transposase
MTVPLSGRYLSFPEREEIAVLKARGAGVREIACRRGRGPSTISWELRRYAATRGGTLDYRSSVAQWRAELLARRPKTAKLVENAQLRRYVQDRFVRPGPPPRRVTGRGSGDGAVEGPEQAASSRPRLGHGRSPEQISNRLKVDFPDDESMRISHEAIYQALYVQSRGALKRELVACLRTGRALRVPRARPRQRANGHITPAVMISQRPAEAEDRAVPGHWEDDLIIGADRSAMGSLVERTTRVTMLLHLPRLAGWGVETPVKNGLALAGHGAVAMRSVIAAQMTTMPDQLRRSLTWDRGKQLAQHTQLKIDTGIAVDGDVKDLSREATVGVVEHNKIELAPTAWKVATSVLGAGTKSSVCS